MCTGIFGKRDIDRIKGEYLDVFNFELKVTEDEILNHHHGLTLAASPTYTPLFAKVCRDAAIIHKDPTNAHQSQRRRRSPPQNVPELQPISPASSSSSEGVFTLPIDTRFYDCLPHAQSSIETAIAITKGPWPGCELNNRRHPEVSPDT